MVNEIKVIEQDLADILMGIILKSPGFDEQGLRSLAKAHGMENDIFEIALRWLERNKRIYKDVEDGIYPEKN